MALFGTFVYAVPGVALATATATVLVMRKLLVGQTLPLQQLGSPNNHVSNLQLHKKLLTSTVYGQVMPINYWLGLVTCQTESMHMHVKAS